MTHAVMQDRYAEFRPTGHVLMVMLRAAAIDDGHGGPWLSLARSHKAQPRRVFVHHISVTEPAHFSQDRVVMCSGLELLGKFCQITGVPARIFDPTRGELRTLADWCCERVNAPLWDADSKAWLREFMGPRAMDRRADERDDAATRVRSLRWLMAEEWLS